MAIHIKPENVGKFNATKKATGKTTEELTHSSNPVTKKRAVFAQNAKKWKHEEGGDIIVDDRKRKKNKKAVPNNYELYSGIVDENGRAVDVPTYDQSIKTMVEYMKNNTPNSNVYRPEFQHYSINTQPIVPIGKKGLNIANWGAMVDPIPVNPFPKGFKVPPAENPQVQSIPVTNAEHLTWNTAATIGDPNPTAPTDIYKSQRIPNTNYVPNVAPTGGALNNGLVPITSGNPSRAPQEAVATPPNMTQQNKPKKQKDFGNALGGKTGADSIPGQIAGATLQVINNVLQEKDRPKNMYLRPEDLPTYNPHPYGVLNSQGQGSQALSKYGKNIKGKKAFWGALIGAVAGGGGAAAAAGPVIGGGTATGLAAGGTATGLASGGTAVGLASGGTPVGLATGGGGVGTSAGIVNAVGSQTPTQMPESKGIKGHWEKPIKQTTDAIKDTLQSTIDFTKMLSTMRETGIDPTNVQQPNYAKQKQIEDENLNRMYKPAMKKGGNIQGSGLMTFDGGSAPKESDNMYDGGTHMFKGDSHAEGGIDSSFKGTSFEAENGEPFAEIGNRGVVFGDLVNPLTGRKYKADAKVIMKKEQRTDKYLMDGIKLVHDKDPYNKFERLAFNAGYATMIGADMKQKQLAESKAHLADLQKAHLDLIGEQSEIARYGKIMTAGEDPEDNPIDPYKGDKKSKHNKSKYSKKEWEIFAGDIGYNGNINDNKAFQRYIWNSEKYGPIAKRVHGVLGSAPDAKGMPKTGRYDDGLLGYRWDQIRDEISNPQIPGERLPRPQVGPYSPEAPIRKNYINTLPTSVPQEAYQFTRPKDYPMSKLKNKMSPLQFTGEANALFDRPEAVKAQLYQPDLLQPYQVSFQDRINEQNSTFNAIQKAVAYDPTALATLAGQKYGANDRVKAEEFRVNQEIATDTTNKNNILLNDAKLKNLSIIDNQYVRQSTAKSITKQNRQNALNSISAKVLQNKSETNELNTYRNLFPHYGFDKDYTAVKEGAPGSDYLSFDGPIGATSPQGRTVTSYDPNGKKKGSRVTTLSPEEQRLQYLQIEEKQRKWGGLPKLFGKNGMIIKKYKE